MNCLFRGLTQAPISPTLGVCANRPARLLAKCTPAQLLRLRSRLYSTQGSSAGVSSAGEQTWAAANAKNPAFAIERDLPGPKSRKREIGIFVAVAAITWGLGTVIAFNYQRMTSTPVTAALFTARHNDEIKQELGSQLNFTSAFPWISGDISHLKGFVEVEFDVVGSKGIVGRLVLNSRRKGNQSGEWQTVDFYVSLPDGRRIDCRQ
ncbi:cytochrome oxidase assembly protein 1 [Coemansia asiatica]|uniref:Cytochrome oxidase assembly protein 1 n=1 Tax=Coemansia asiatica TaxID=1052880 RepID=A0A9W7XIS0_9FUNG|nr:cytochrome oxidase assembly protein 1 [Coemansia asiatica]